MVVHTVGFVQIYYVEFVSDVLADVHDFEVEPLSIDCGTIVVLQDQIVLIVSNRKNPPEVSRLKATLKY